MRDRLADLAPIALIQCDADSNIEDVNDAAEQLLGQSRSKLVGAHLSSAFYKSSDVFRLIDKALSSQTPIASQNVAIGGPKISVPSIDIRLSPIAGGYVIAVLAAASRTAEGTRVGMADFSRILGHEIKNPLAGISGAAQLLQRSARDDQTELLQLVIDESARIERLVTELSAFELYSSPRRGPVNIHRLLDRIIVGEEAAFDGKCRFIRNFDPSLPTVYGDADHLHEAAQNLMRNGAEAASSTVKIHTAFEAGVIIRRSEDDVRMPAMRLTIEDDGEGVTPEQEDAMFRMFETWKPGGSGLGLALVSQIADAHDAQIIVNSQPGRMRVSMLLPLTDQGV